MDIVSIHATNWTAKDDVDDDESSDDEDSMCSSKVSKPPARSKRGGQTKAKGKKMERGTCSYWLEYEYTNMGLLYIVYTLNSINALSLLHASIRQRIQQRAR